MKVDNETFVEIWQRARSLDEVVERTGMRRYTASHRAWWLRTKGVPLKPFAKGRSYYELAELARATNEDPEPDGAP